MKPYSQLSSEYLVDEFFESKKEGTFLDVGCAAPFKINNTAFLEKNYDWRGVAVDISPHETSEWITDSPYEEDWSLRSNTHVYEANALEFDYATAFEKANMPDVIDYLSIDLDTIENNCIMCEKLLSSKEFRMVQLETDEFRLQNPKEVLSAIHQTFKRFGYEYFVTLAALHKLAHDPSKSPSPRKLLALPQDIIFVNKQYAEKTFSEFPSVGPVQFDDEDPRLEVMFLPSPDVKFSKSINHSRSKSCFYRMNPESMPDNIDTTDGWCLHIPLQ